MTGEGDELRATAVRNLTALGLSEYAARTLVALIRIGGGSARDVSDASSVPRTRVYDAVDELADRGFVSVRESHPRVFVPTGPTQVRRAFYREYVCRQLFAEWGLGALESGSGSAEGDGVETATGAAAVRQRFLDAIDAAEDALTYVSVSQTPETEVMSRLREATDRDVDVRVVGVGQFDPEAVRDAAPDAAVFTVAHTPTGSPEPARLLLVDGTVALVATLNGPDGSETEVGLFVHGYDSEVGVLLETVVESFVADAA